MKRSTYKFSATNKAYPIKWKAECYKGLKTFVRKYGAIVHLVYDGSPEQIGRKTEFQHIIQKYDIRVHVAEFGR